MTLLNVISTVTISMKTGIGIYIDFAGTFNSSVWGHSAGQYQYKYEEHPMSIRSLM